MRELRAITDALRDDVRARRLRRGLHAGGRVRGRARAAATSAPPARAYRAVRRARRRARAALGHDDPDRARRRARATPTPSRRCASATSRTPTAPSRPQRGPACASSCRPGIELVGAPGAGGHGRGAHACSCAALDAVGLRDYRVGLGDASLYPALLDALGVAEERARAAARTSSATRDLVGLEREVARARAGAARPRACSCACRSCAAGRRCSTRAPGPVARRARRAARRARRCSTPRRRRARDLRPRARARASATTPARCSRSTTPRSASPLGGGGRYDDLLGRFGRAAAGRAASRSTSSACTSRWRARSGGERD